MTDPIDQTLAGQLWVLDLDGVVWRGSKEVDGSRDAIDRLQRAGATVVFATNNSTRTPEQVTARLAHLGIRSQGNIVTSSEAAASLLRPGERVMVIGEHGIADAAAKAGAVPTSGPCDTVLVGLSRHFDYETLRAAGHAIRDGARLVATNDDTTFPATDGRLDPGCGAIVAAIEAAGGRPAAVAGKPHQPIVDLIRRRWGTAPGVGVGDRPETDGLLAHALGLDFGLVLSGVTSEEALPVTPGPEHVVADLAGMVCRLLDHTTVE